MEANHHDHHSSWDINNTWDTWDHTWWTRPPFPAASTVISGPSTAGVVAASVLTTSVVPTAVEAGGPVSTPTPIPPSSGQALSLCLENCKTNFANSIFPGDRDYDKVCEILSHESPASRFSPLYSCDSSCGLTSSGPCQDPNINAIVAQCHSIGYPDMSDVGPTPTSQNSMASIPTSTSIPSLIAEPSSTFITLQTAISSLKSSPTNSASLALASSSPTSDKPVHGTASSLNYPSQEPSYSSVSYTEMSAIIPTTTYITEQVSPTPATTHSPNPGSTSQNPAGPEPEFPSSMSKDEKIGLIIGLVIFLLLIIVFAILFKRHKKKDALFGGRMPEEMASTSVFYARYENDSVPLIIEAGEPKGSLDSAGIRWPEKAVLAGEAKEVHDLTMEFERGYKERKAASSERREVERRAHWSAENGGMMVIKDWI